MSRKFQGFIPSYLAAGFLILLFLAITPYSFGSDREARLNPALYSEYLSLLRLRADNRYDDLIEGMKRILQRDPTFWRASQKIVEAYVVKQDLDSAVAYFQGLRDSDPQNLYAYYGLGLALRWKRDHTAWLENFASCLGIDSRFKLIYRTYREKVPNGIGGLPGLVDSRIHMEPGNAAAHYGKALVAEYHSDWDQALASLDTALNLDPNFTEAYVAKTYIYTAKGDGQKLLSAAEAGLRLANELEDDEYRLHFIWSIAKAYYLTADYITALDYFNQALQIADRLADKMAKQIQLGSIGLIHTELNAYTTALLDLEQALEISRQIGAASDEQMHLGNLGRVYAKLGQYARALDYLNEALALAERIQDNRGRANHLTNISYTYIRSGQFERALGTLAQAQKIARALNNRRTEGYIYLSMGDVELELRNGPKALEYCQQALTMAQELSERKLESSALDCIGQAYLQMDQDSGAIEYHRRELAIGNETQTRSVISLAHIGLGSVYEKQNELEKALSEYKLAIQTIEDVRAGISQEENRVSFLGSKMGPYEKLISLLVKLHRMYPAAGYDREAFRYVEKVKARTMVDILKGSRSKTELKETPIDLAAAQALLDDKTVLMEYFLGNGLSLAFAVTRKDFKMSRLRRAEIEHLAKKFQASTKDPANHSAYLTYTLTAHKLYNLLVKPSETLLRSKSRLVVVADGALHYIPFAALLDRKVEINGDVDFNKLPYLIKKYAINHVHSAGVLKALRESKPHRAEQIKFLGVAANPNFKRLTPNGYLESGLLYSKAEVNTIAHLYGSNSIVVKPIRESILQEMRKADYKGIHFTVCGLFDGKEPKLDLSCSADAKTQRYLKLDDILTLKLSADLVVLSACQTGLGSDQKGEGLMGFSRAFIHAGASSVLVTLWNISDKSSLEFMVKFYKHYLAEDKKADALRLAALDLIKSKYAHPFYWASFVLFGAERSLGKL